MRRRLIINNSTVKGKNPLDQLQGGMSGEPETPTKTGDEPIEANPSVMESPLPSNDEIEACKKAIQDEEGLAPGTG